MRLVAVAETHLHNDYVSGGLELARKHGVDYLVPCEAEVDYERVLVCGRDVRTVGSFTIHTLATPGHTPHHVAFAVGTRRAALGGADRRVDALRLRGAHRPRQPRPAPRSSAGRSGPRSARLGEALPGGTAVLPTHGFGSFCSATPTTGTSSTIEEQRRDNPAFQQDEDEFVKGLLEGFDAYPAYYAHMGPANSTAPAPVDLSPVEKADPEELRRRIDAGEWVVDLRNRTAFARGHVPGTLNFEGTGNVVTYLGWLIPWGTPVTLLAETAEEVAETQRSLVRIGIDRPAAQATGTPEQWADGRAAGDVPAGGLRGPRARARARRGARPRRAPRRRAGLGLGRGLAARPAARARQPARRGPRPRGLGALRQRVPRVRSPGRCWTRVASRSP